MPGPGGYAPGGVCSRGVYAAGGCLVEMPPGRLLLRAVSILLECILVYISKDSYAETFELFAVKHR